MVTGNVDSTYPKKDEATKIPKGNVTIKTGTVAPDGDCTKAAPALDLTDAKAKITANEDGDKGPTLKITDIKDANALEDTDDGTECSVSVDTDSKTLTINYTPTGGVKKCIEITLTDTDTKKAADGTPVDNSFRHAFDILIVIKIYLAAAVLWTYAYYRGEDAKDGYPPKDPKQRSCQKLTVAATKSGNATALTYSIDPNFAESHADNCGFKNSVEYYAHFIPPSLMVLVGMGLPLPNLTIEPTVSSFVIVVKFLFIVLGTIDSAGDLTISETESKAGCC